MQLFQDKDYECIICRISGAIRVLIDNSMEICNAIIENNLLPLIISRIEYTTYIHFISSEYYDEEELQEDCVYIISHILMAGNNTQVQVTFHNFITFRLCLIQIELKRFSLSSLNMNQNL